VDVTAHLITGAFVAAGVAKGNAHGVSIATAVFVGAMAPDFDAVLYPMGPSLYWRYHRVYTHTLLGLVILSGATASVMQSLGAPLAFWVLFSSAFLGSLVHLFLDTLTGYPLRPLAPFSNRDYALGLLPFDDPFTKGTGLVGFGLITWWPSRYAPFLTVAGIFAILGRALYQLSLLKEASWGENREEEG